jgi:hypothetical protein
MPHQGMIIICKKCKKEYCVGCFSVCSKCGTKDNADSKIMRSRKRVQDQTRRYLEEKMHGNVPILPVRKALAELRKQKRDVVKSSLSGNYIKVHFKLSDKKLNEIPSFIKNKKVRYKKSDVLAYLEQIYSYQQKKIF